MGEESSTRDEDGAGQSVLADVSSAASDAGRTECTTLLPAHPRTCVKCKAQTNRFQYCLHCYKVRKDFFPPRPRRYKKKSTKHSFKKNSIIKDPSKLPLVKGNQNNLWGESSSSQELTPTSSLMNCPEGLCNLCFQAPKDGAFVHCRWVHIYCCYQCSLKTWFTKNRCPLCNGKISKVLKVSVG